MNSAGNFIARYRYDAWGVPIAITDGNGNDVSSNSSHIANINPIRYRGYYYDTETGFYYLQSRYYDPVVGRFINADGLVSTGQGVLGQNMFAYCLNNPVNMCDPTGTMSKEAQAALVSALLETAKTAGAIGTAVAKTLVSSVPTSSSSVTSSTSKTKSPTPKNKNIEPEKIKFADETWVQATTISETSGIPAEIIFAQACMESSYGTHKNYINGNNVFNIKGTGPAGAIRMSGAIEWDKKGNAYREDSLFKAYNSIDESYADYTSLLNSRYRSFLGVDSISGWAAALQEGGYSTQPGFANEILNVIGWWGL